VHVFIWALLKVEAIEISQKWLCRPKFDTGFQYNTVAWAGWSRH